MFWPRAQGRSQNKKCKGAEPQRSSAAMEPDLPHAPEANIGALRIRIGFWGPLYYNSGKEII